MNKLQITGSYHHYLKALITSLLCFTLVACGGDSNTPNAAVPEIIELETS